MGGCFYSDDVMGVCVRNHRSCITHGSILTYSYHVEILAFLVMGLAFVHGGLGHLSVWRVVMYSAGYLLIGAVWSVIKWWLNETNRVRKARNEYESIKDNGNSHLTWEQFRDRHKTKVSLEKDLIVAWILLWVFNIPYTFLHDIVVRVARRIYTELTRVYQRITDHVWSHV